MRIWWENCTGQYIQFKVVSFFLKVQMFIYKVEFMYKELFFIIQSLLQFQNSPFPCWDTSLATTNARPDIIWIQINNS